jgi:hypothetical protein
MYYNNPSRIKNMICANVTIAEETPGSVGESKVEAPAAADTEAKA